MKRIVSRKTMRIHMLIFHALEPVSKLNGQVQNTIIQVYGAYMGGQKFTHTLETCTW